MGSGRADLPRRYRSSRVRPARADGRHLRLLELTPDFRALELGCGSGHSLRYLAERGACELWGLDLSPVQIAFAEETLRPFVERVRLVESPMEVNPGIPLGILDLVFSIYGLGWTTDLPGTLALVVDYLRPGAFIRAESTRRTLPRVGREAVRHGGTVQCRRRLRAQLVEGRAHRHRAPHAGHVRHRDRPRGTRIETLVEGELNEDLAKEAHADPARWYSVARARMMPTTFIIKARMPGWRRMPDAT